MGPAVVFLALDTPIAPEQISDQRGPDCLVKPKIKHICRIPIIVHYFQLVSYYSNFCTSTQKLATNPPSRLADSCTLMLASSEIQSAASELIVDTSY